MPYIRSRVRRRGGLGFTPDEEKEILAGQRASSGQLKELVDQARSAERIRTITIVATVGGLVYTLARIGELVAGVRARRHQPEEKGVSW